MDADWIFLQSESWGEACMVIIPTQEQAEWKGTALNKKIKKKRGGGVQWEWIAVGQSFGVTHLFWNMVLKKKKKKKKT